MTAMRIILDNTTLERLQGRDTLAELCDASGSLVGYFIPAGMLREDYQWAVRQFTDVEIERARREPGGLSIDEVLASLR